MPGEENPVRESIKAIMTKSRSEEGLQIVKLVELIDSTRTYIDLAVSQTIVCFKEIVIL